MGVGEEGLGLFGGDGHGAGVFGGLFSLGYLCECEGCGWHGVGWVDACDERVGGFVVGFRESLSPGPLPFIMGIVGCGLWV